MKPQTDETQFEWIREGTNELLASDDPRWKGNFVSHLLPSVFEGYVKVLHQIDANYEHIDNPLTQDEQVLLKIPKCEKLRKFVEEHRIESSSSRGTVEAVGRITSSTFSETDKF